MKNNLIKLLTKNKEIRLFIADITEVLKYSNYSEMRTEFAQHLFTNIMIDCCLLRGLLTEADQRISVCIRFRPAGYTAHCDIDGGGNINCVFSSQLASFQGRFTDLIGEGASLSITRGSWLDGMFTGTVELKAASMDVCFSHYYSRSEQTITIFRTWIEEGVARGCLIQPLPFYDSNHLQSVTDHMDGANHDFITTPWEELPQRLFPNADVVDQYTLQTECGCSKEMFFGMLMSVASEDLQKSIRTGKTEELECGICGKRYYFDTNDLERIIKMKEREKDGYLP